MTPLNFMLIVAAVLAAAVLVFAVFPRLLLGRLERVLERRVARAVPPGTVLLSDLRAVTLGQTSLGRLQARGNGALVLTRDALRFFQAVPRRELAIPRTAITEVGIVRSHLGKGYGRDLLHVAFHNPEGGSDDAAWLVSDLSAWLRALRPPR